MNQLSFPLLSIVLWLPALGALLLLLVPRDNGVAQRAVALAAALATLAAAVVLPIAFDYSQPGFQFVDSLPWVELWGLSYRVSVDGLSLWLVLLTAVLAPLALLAAWQTERSNERSFLGLLLLLETALLGVFVAQDMLLFFVFFEFTLVPTALLIGIWGGEERASAATKFFLYNFAGSIFMLIGVIGLYLAHGQATGSYTFDIATLSASVSSGALVLDTWLSRTLFGAFFVAFAVKAPLWPFHTWLPDAHAAAPDDGSIDALGLLVKIGAYGFIRFNLQLLPEAARWAAPAIAVLAVIGILYGAAVAYAQTDLKRLLAYSSLSHVGFIILGIFALTEQGIAGALLQIVNQGLVSSGLFFVVGIIAARQATRNLPQLSGLWKAMPVLGSLTLALILASVGLPGLNGFIGEFVIMQGTWLSSVLGWRFVFPAVIGVILAAAYLLRMFRIAFMGDLSPTAVSQDIAPREIGLLALVFALSLAIGLYPNLIFGPMQPAVQQLGQTLLGAVASLP